MVSFGDIALKVFKKECVFYMKQTQIGIAPRGKQRIRDRIWRDRYLYLMILPFMTWFVFMYYLPMYGILMAFQDFKIRKGIWGSEWVGFKHFVDFFANNHNAWRLIRNTLLINVYSIVFTFPLPIILALLFDELRSKKYKTFAQTISYMPHFISTVVVVGLVVTMLSPSQGIVNIMLEKLGFERVYFLVKAKYFRTIYITMGAWTSVGFSSIIYTSAISSVDETLYEAARIDGASRFQKVMHITIPCILPTIAIMLITRIGGLLSVGSETIILLYNNSTRETADVISTYIYRRSIEASAATAQKTYSSSAAIGLMNSFVSVLLVMLANYISKKTTDAGLF